MKDGLLEPGDPGYAEAKAKREARWASREATQKNALHADTGEGVKSASETEIEKNAPKTPLFKSKIGKKIASTLTKAGDKAQELRDKKDYLNQQLNRITGGPIKLKPKQKLQKISRPSTGYQRVKYYRPPRQLIQDITRKPAARSNSDVMDDLIHGKSRDQLGHRDLMSDMIHGDKHGNGSSHANDLIFGKPKKNNGKRNDPFDGLLG